MWWALLGLGVVYLAAVRRVSPQRNPARRRGRRAGGARHAWPGRARPRRNPVAEPRELERAARDYRAFHGLAHRRFDVVTLPEPPRTLWKLGRALRVDYEVEAPSRKAGVQYTHEWGDTGREVRKDRPVLAVDEHGNLWLVRDRSRYRVNRRGIVG